MIHSIKLFSHSVFFWLDELLGGDEDTVQEFSLILLFDVADTGNLSAAKGDISVIDTLEDELVLDILGWVLHDSASFLHLDEMRFLSTEEVLDLNLFLVLGDDSSNGEMCMNHFHSVSETLY